MSSQSMSFLGGLKDTPSLNKRILSTLKDSSRVNALCYVVSGSGSGLFFRLDPSIRHFVSASLKTILGNKDHHRMTTLKGRDNPS